MNGKTIIENWRQLPPNIKVYICVGSPKRRGTKRCADEPSTPGASVEHSTPTCGTPKFQKLTAADETSEEEQDAGTSASPLMNEEEEASLFYSYHAWHRPGDVVVIDDWDGVEEK